MWGQYLRHSPVSSISLSVCLSSCLNALAAPSPTSSSKGTDVRLVLTLLQTQSLVPTGLCALIVVNASSLLITQSRVSYARSVTHRTHLLCLLPNLWSGRVLFLLETRIFIMRWHIQQMLGLIVLETPLSTAIHCNPTVTIGTAMKTMWVLPLSVYSKQDLRCFIQPRYHQAQEVYKDYQNGYADALTRANSGMRVARPKLRGIEDKTSKPVVKINIVVSPNIHLFSSCV